MTLAMLAYALLVVAAVTEHARHRPPLGLIPLTRNEIHRLFAVLVAAPWRTPATGCAGLVATTAPGPRPGLPPPPANQRTVTITNSGWSIKLQLHVD